MAYVEELQRGKKTSYYLTKNIRQGNTWKKIRVYLGNKAPKKQDIAKAAREMERKAKERGLLPSPYTYLDEKDAELLQDLKSGFDAWKKITPVSVQKKIDDDFAIRFTYNSNAIEGNRLSLRQTALILKDKVIPSGIRAKDYHEAINGRDCLDFLKQYRGSVNNLFIESINGILTKDTDVVYAGRIRFFDVKIEGSRHTPPKHDEVKKLLLNLYKYYSANKNKLHAFELAAIIHAKIAWVHPFEDGNGRTARAVMNWILLKKGYPMFFIPVEKREQYYSALETADTGNYKEYVSQMLKLVVEQVNMYGHK